jgi:hypothetical protein
MTDKARALSHTIEMRQERTGRFVETASIPKARRVEHRDELMLGLSSGVFLMVASALQPRMTAQ